MNDNLPSLFNDFILECEFSRKLRPETIRGYRNTFETFHKIMPQVSTELLTSAVLTRFFKVLNERQRVVGKNRVRVGVKKSTIATYWSKLNSFFEWLKIRKIILINPFSEMKYPNPVYEDRKFLRRDQVEKILTAVLNHSNGNIVFLKRNLVIFHLLLFCGLRRGELLGLQIRDFDFYRKTLTVRAETSKSGRTRYLPIHSQLLLHLQDYVKTRSRYTSPYLLISSKKDEKLTSDGLKHLIVSLRIKSGVRFHLHQFRHTFAVNFLKQSNNIAKLKQLLGHTDIRMTLQYLRCLPTKEMRSDIENINIDGLI